MAHVIHHVLDIYYNIIQRALTHRSIEPFLSLRLLPLFVSSLFSSPSLLPPPPSSLHASTGIGHRGLRPLLGIVDPLHMKYMPTNVAIFSGFDVLW